MDSQTIISGYKLKQTLHGNYLMQLILSIRRVKLTILGKFRGKGRSASLLAIMSFLHIIG